jgi:tetratricopeptide (TPR) repeat protein
MSDLQSQILRSIRIYFRLLPKATTAVGFVGCCLLVLFGFGILTIPVPLLATVLVTLVVLFLPGFLLIHIIWPSLPPLLDQLVLAFSLSVSIFSIPATLLLVLHSDLLTMIQIILAITLFLALVSYLRWRPNRATEAGIKSLAISPPAGQARFSKYEWPELVYWGAFLAAIVLAVVVFANSISPFPGDRLTYQAFLRHFLDAKRFLTMGFRMSDTLVVKSSREVIQPWVLLLAVIVKLAQVDVLDAYVYYIPLLLIPVSFFAFYLLARELFGNQITALSASLVQLVYYLSDIPVHEGIGRSFFLRLIEDKFLLRFVFLPVALWLSLRYFKNGDKETLAIIIAIIVATGLIHPLGVILYGMSFFSFLLVAFLSDKRRLNKDNLLQLAPLVITVLLTLVVPFWQRQQIARTVAPIESFNVTAANAFDINIGLTTASGELRASRIFLLPGESGLYIASPHLIAHPFVILAILLAPLLLKYLRTHLSAQFLFSNTLAGLVLCYVPIITPLLGKLITPWVIWRVLWLLPVSLVIGFFIGEVFQKLTSCFQKQSVQWLQLLPLGLVLIAVLAVQGNISKGLDELEETKSNAVTDEQIDILTYLRGHGIPGSYILSPGSPFSNEIPGLVGHSYELTFRTLPSPFPSADEDRTRFYEAGFVTDTHLDILQQYNIKYIILERETDLAYQFQWLSGMFKPLYANRSYLLFQWQPELATQADIEIVQGNTHLLQGDLAAAEMAYQAALRHEPEHPLAAIGLGRLYLDEARVQDALAVYQQAIASVPHDPRLHLYLAEAYLAQGETAEDPEAYREAVKAYRQAFDLAPDNPQIQDALVQAYLALGDQYFEQNLMSQVIAAYEKAIQLDPDNRQVYWKLAEVYETLGQMDQAVAVYARVVARWPERGDAHLRLGQAYEARGDVERAVAEYKKAINLDPSLAGAYTRLGDLYENRDTPQEAIGLYRTAARKNPGAAWPHLELGKLYLNQGIAGTGDETN